MGLPPLQMVEKYAVICVEVGLQCHVVTVSAEPGANRRICEETVGHQKLLSTVKGMAQDPSGRDILRMVVDLGVHEVAHNQVMLNCSNSLFLHN